MNDLIVKSESGGMELSSSALNTLMKYEETLAALKTDYDELKKKLLQEMEKKNVIKVETGGIELITLPRLTERNLIVKPSEMNTLIYMIHILILYRSRHV